MKGCDFVLSSFFYCLEVLLFPGFYIPGRNRISYILMDAFTCVCPFISKSITEHIWLPGQFWPSHNIHDFWQIFIVLYISDTNGPQSIMCPLKLPLRYFQSPTMPLSVCDTRYHIDVPYISPESITGNVIVTSKLTSLESRHVPFALSLNA